MRIAYLLHYMGKNYEEVTENIDQMIELGDDVYIMINDEELRDQVFMAYASVPEMHLCTAQPAALPADMSLPRGTLMAIRDALEVEEEDDITYDYFINLGDGMLPIKSREEIEAWLESLEGRDAWHKTADSRTDERVAKRFEEYAFFTNSMDFQKSRMIRGMNSLTKNVVKAFKQRTTEDTIVESWPWFVISHDSAQKLAENYGYCSNEFKMCLYPEEMAIATMLNKFTDKEPVQADIWVSGEGDYKLQQPEKNTTESAIASKPDALFAGKIQVEKDPGLYADVFDSYTRNHQ